MYIFGPDCRCCCHPPRLQSIKTRTIAEDDENPSKGDNRMVQMLFRETCLLASPALAGCRTRRMFSELRQFALLSLMQEYTLRIVCS